MLLQMNMNWEQEKSLQTLEYAEERKQIIHQGNVLAGYMSKENERLRKEAQNTVQKLDQYRDPIKHGKELYRQVRTYCHTI